MKILHVTEAVPGGTATYLNALLPWQRRTLGEGRVGLVYPLSDAATLSAEVRDSITLFGYPRSGRDLRSLLTLRKTLASASREFAPQLIHAHNSFAGAITRTRTTLPVVYTPHGWAFSRTGSTAARRIYSLVESMLARRTAAIVAVSADEQRSAIAAGIPASRLHRILSGLPDQADAPRQLSGGTTGPLRLLFVGRFDRQKGLDWLIEALRPLGTDVRLTALGAPRVDGSALPRADGVEFPGWVDAAALNGYLDAADALVVPSRWEAFGLVAVEAMRRGVPVIASRCGGLPEVVADSETGLLFDLENPQAFRDMLLGLDRQRLATMGQRGRERYLRLFTADRMCREMQAVYQSVVPRGP
ncbi:MAG: glycosyltransferase family 4 protein [Pseudomonadota bacterium]|nr:glycosyltransferase family 4 protein [Pseudomonadota bacterium]